MMKTGPKDILPALEDFRSDESGVGTVTSLFFIIMFLLIGGIAIDGTNLWRNHQLLQQTADVAAHSGVVQMAAGKSETDVRTSTVDMVKTNMPETDYGNLFSSATNDIELLTYDPDTNTLSTTGQPNAVRVTLHRNDSSGNPLATYVLRLANMLSIGTDKDLSQWQLSANGIATLADTKMCNSSDGIYAKGTVSMSGGNVIGSGYCVHSQELVWLSQDNTFEPGSALSMPDLADCGDKCTDAANPGTTDASWEYNMLLPDYRARILAAEASFLGSGDPTIKDNFFSGKTLETGALFNLENAGFDTTTLATGSVVTMTEAEFEAIPDLPEGLVYNVSCNPFGTGPDAEIQLFKNNGGHDLRNLALISNCYVKFAKDASAQSTAIITTRDVADDTITSISGTTIGHSVNACDGASRSLLMALGGMHVAAKFIGSNVDIVIDGNIHLASSPTSGATLTHNGVNMHASGEISISQGHTFNGCSHADAGIGLSLPVIRHVYPSTL